MIDERQVVERVMRGFVPRDDSFERLLNRRDRKRRNKRIAAGAVGIAVFVAAAWIVTSGLSFDRSTPAAPGGSKTGPTQTAPPAASATTAPDVVRQGRCSDGARSHLELTSLANLGGLIQVRFEVHHSPMHTEWRIELRHYENTIAPFYGWIFRGIKPTRPDGDLRPGWGALAVTRTAPNSPGGRIVAKAFNTQTGERCSVHAQLDSV